MSNDENNFAIIFTFCGSSSVVERLLAKEKVEGSSPFCRSMDTNFDKLQEIIGILAKLVDGNNLTSAESEKAFTTTFLYDKEGYYSAVLMAAIHAKGETSDELLGFVNMYKNTSTHFNLDISKTKLTDLSGTGAGSFKTINVSTASSFVVASAGYTVGKAAYYGITSPTGSADIFAAFGIDIKKLKKDMIEDTLKKVGICPFFISFISPKHANRAIVSRKIFGELKLKIRSPFHIATNVYSPLPLEHRLYGCYSQKYLETLGNLFAKLNFKRSLVVHGEIGIPEISNVGKTFIVEQNGKRIKKYTVTPLDLGVKEADIEDIRTGNKEQNIIDFVNILKGKEKGAKADLVAVNAGAALYAQEDVSNIKDGVIKAKKILQSGESYQVLERLVTKIGESKSLKAF